MLVRSLIFSAILALLGLVGLWLLPKPDTLLSLSAQTNYLAYEVIDPNASTIRFENALLIQRSSDPFSVDEVSRTCVTGSFIPNAGTIVSYQSTGSSGVTITVSGDRETSRLARVTPEIDRELPLSEFDVLDLSRDRDACISEFGSLPVWGPGEIGSVRTFGASHTLSKELLNGEMIIMAKAIERLFFVIPGAKGLYEAGTVTIPAGAQIRIEEGGWIGSARHSSENSSLLQVDLSTDNDVVWMWRAGTSADAGATAIGASAFVRQTRDPGVIGLQIALAMILLITQTVAGLAQTVRQ